MFSLKRTAVIGFVCFGFGFALAAYLISGSANGAAKFAIAAAFIGFLLWPKSPY